MNTQHDVEEKLWDYIDGHCSATEKSSIEKLLESNLQWKEKYRELLEVNQLIHSSELQEPSMRFTKKVMEEIAKYHVAPATKTYINKYIIRGIFIFFLTLIVGFLVYGFSQVDWSATNGATSQYIDVNKVDFSKFFNNTFINVFMMLNAVLGLMLLDRYLASKRKELKKEM